MSSYLTDAELKQAVSDALHKPNPSLLPPVWDGIVSQANEAAYQDILGALQERGYSLPQIDGWVRGKTVQKLQGLYWALVIGVGLHTVDPTWVNKLDQRASLTTIAVSGVGGDAVGPGASPGIIDVGNLDTTKDRWNEKTRW